MNRPPYILWIVLGLIVALCPIGAAARPRSVSTYEGRVDFGAQLLHLEDGCLSVDGAVTSENFFDDLKRIDVGGQLEYRKSGRVVTKYPESVTTSIRIISDRCRASISTSPSELFRDGAYAVKFTVEWKDGLQLRPAVLSPVAAHCVGYSTITVLGRPPVPSIECQLTVDSRGVPLANHLIVSIHTADGTRLTRLSAAP